MSGFAPLTWLRLGTAAAAVIMVIMLVAATAVTSIQPAIPGNFPDPAVLSVDGDYYAYSTASTYGNRFWHVPVQRSGELDSGWSPVGDALPTLPGWVLRDAHGDGNVTAPEVTRRTDGRYLLYFVARSVSQGAQCIGTALSGDPAGPFTAAPAPLICQPGYVDSIDPQAFTDVDGRHYLLYAAGQTRTTIWLQQLTPDGTAPVGPRRGLITADRPDEANIVEAPSLVRHGSGSQAEYVLFYSGDTFDSGHYFVNYAVAPSLAGPFAKSAGQLINRDSLGGRYPDTGGQTVLSQGHDSDRDDPDDGPAGIADSGPDSIIFHATTAPHVRAMFVAGLTWDPRGRPIVDLDHGLTHRYSALQSVVR
jgi:arabinan endo-1,5-alpha-L-arabinosidase